MGGEIAWRKISAFFVLMIPSVAMFFQGCTCGFLSCPDLQSRYCPFLVASVVVLILTVVMAKVSGWSLTRSGRNSLGNFFRLFLSRFFVGELALSLYGLFIFVLFAIILTAWLPDALENNKPMLAMGSVLYFLSIIFATAFAYPAPKPRKDENSTRPKPAKYLVYALSIPTRPWSDVKAYRCEDLRGNNTGLNINPLYITLYYHLKDDEEKRSRLEVLYLLITSGHVENWEEMKKGGNSFPGIRDQLKDFLEKTSECLGVSFRIEWPCEEAETIGSWERTVTVKFVDVGDPNDVKSIFQAIAKSEIRELIERNSDDVTFHLTGGTAPVSIAMMLHAIKGDTHAEYIKQKVHDAEKQNVPNVKPEDLLMAVDMDIFDLEDLARELKEYFERLYERNLG